ncbi:MAG: hypothetical protein ABJE95_05400 [Byssovorax sp.]
MISRFEVLLSLRVSHAYYGGEVCEDFEFVLPGESARIMRRGRLLSRARDGVLRVLFEAQEDGTPRIPAGDATLRIGLQLRTPSLLNVTDPPPSVSPEVTLYRNRTSKGALDAGERRLLVGNGLAHRITRATRPVTVTVTSDAGAAVQIDALTDANDRPSITLDASTDSLGPFSVVEDYGGGDTATVLYYRHPELQQIGVSAVVEVGIPAAFYTAAPSFEIALGARVETLRYYLVVSHYADLEFASLTVTDAGDLVSPIVFTRATDAALALDPLKALLAPAAEPRLALFSSTTPVPRRALGRKKIQLNASLSPLIENLPQPGPDRADANMILHISK